MSTDMLPVHRTVALPSEDEAARMWRLAERTCGTDMVPSSFRGNPSAVLACALAGREIGLGFFESLRNFHVIEGKPSESAELLHTLALRAGHDIWVEESTSTRCVVRARHRDWPEDRTPSTIEWTVEDAAAAELVAWDCLDTWPKHVMREVTKSGRNGTYKVTTCGCKDNWRKYARSMLRSRALTEAVRGTCPEVTVGATYSPEELGAAVSGPGGVPDGAPVGFGASGESFEMPSLSYVDGAWVAMHTPDQVLAMVDHYGPDAVQSDSFDHTLVDWVIACEESGERRPRLLEALAARRPEVEVDETGEPIEDAEVVEDVETPAPTDPPEGQPAPSSEEVDRAPESVKPAVDDAAPEGEGSPAGVDPAGEPVASCEGTRHVGPMDRIGIARTRCRSCGATGGPDGPGTPETKADGGAPADAEPAPNEPSWRTVATDMGVPPVAVVAALVKEWPKNDQAARPNNLKDVDRLAAQPEYRDLVRATIEDIAAERASA